MNRNVIGAACALGAAALLGAAATRAQQGMPHRATMSAPAPITRAVAVLHPTQGNNVHGVVTFTRVVGRVRVVADIEGLTPGEHGFHIHEWGDCTAPDATSAGGHFNPTGAPHSGPTAGERHIGDMGNITADASGKAHYDRFLSLITFEGRNSVIGRAVIVHAKADDLKTQPTGDAGGRVACGVIGVAKNP